MLARWKICFFKEFKTAEITPWWRILKQCGRHRTLRRRVRAVCHHLQHRADKETLTVAETPGPLEKELQDSRLFRYAARQVCHAACRLVLHMRHRDPPPILSHSHAIRCEQEACSRWRILARASHLMDMQWMLFSDKGNELSIYVLGAALTSVSLKMVCLTEPTGTGNQ